MEILKIHNNPERAEWAALTERFTRQEEEITRQVAEILADVKSGGDRSLREITRRVEGRDPGTFEVPADVRAEAAALIPAALKEALATAKTNIETFHRAQLAPEVDTETMPGIRCVQRAVPIRRVGLYIPGGKAPLFSTVLMLAVPARVAGCGEVILCTPAHPDGTIAPEILYAADLCGVDRIFSVGGAQAVAAMAYGTESIPRVDKIFGPGNRYVTKAKQLVGANDVAVDLPAGPSEVLVLADDEASPAFAAADLLSQAEHGGDSQAVLVCPSVEFARDTQRAVGEQLLQLRRGDTIREALRQSRIVVLDSREKMIDFANAYAPRAPDRLDARRVGRRGADHRRRERLHRSVVARKRRGLRLGNQPHAAHGRLGAGLQRREHRLVPAQDHLPGTLAQGACGPLPDDHRHGRGRRSRGARRRRAHPHERRCAVRPLEELVRPNIRALKPYSTARDEYSGGEITTWLDANENPYDNGVNRYPDPHQKVLKQKIAALKGVRGGANLHRQRQRRGHRPLLPHLLPPGRGQHRFDRPDLRHVPRRRRRQRRRDARGSARYGLLASGRRPAERRRRTHQTAVALLPEQPHGQRLPGGRHRAARPPVRRHGRPRRSLHRLRLRAGIPRAARRI